jgi:hypothetical protein
LVSTHGNPAMKRFRRNFLLLVPMLFLSTSTQSQWVQQENFLWVPDIWGNQGYAVALSGDGHTAVRGGADSSSRGVWVFGPTDTVWQQQGEKLLGTGAIGDANQGHALSLSADGNTLLVGGPSDDGYEDIIGVWQSVGAAWVFTRGGGVWSQQGDKLVGTGGGIAKQGASVALSADGNTAIVGGHYDNWWDGAAWVFVRIDSGWVQQGSKLIAPNAIADSYFGWSVAISGDGNTALVGAMGDSLGAGAAWVFVRTGNTWRNQGPKLVGSGAVWDSVGSSWYGAGQGRAVAISSDGKTALVGGPSDSAGVGAAWVFTRTDSVWSQQGPKLVGKGAVHKPYLGDAVALSADGNTALLGGPFDAAVWVFTRSDGVWKQDGDRLFARSNGQPIGGGGQGGHVALSADGKTAMSGGFVFVQKPLNVSDADASLPRMYSISQNYPNPFNPSTTIRYALPHRSHVTLSVYNTLGQLVGSLVNGDIEAGSHEVTFNATGLASGVYFYRIQAGDFVQIRKLVLVK